MTSWAGYLRTCTTQGGRACFLPISTAHFLLVGKLNWDLNKCGVIFSSLDGAVDIFQKKWNGAFMQLNAVPIRLASNKLSGMWWGKAKPKWIGGRRCDWCDMSRIDPGLRITSSSSATHQRISCNASQFHLLHLAAAVVVNFWIRLWWSVHQPGKKIYFLTCSLNLSLPPHFISPASWWDNRMELRHQKRSSVSPSPPSLF